MKTRLTILSLVFMLAYGTAAWHLYRIQIEQGESYVARAAARRAAEEELELRRGRIFFTDRTGGAVVAATQHDYPVIFAVPGEVEDPGAAAGALAPIVGRDALALEASLRNRKSKFSLLMDRAPQAAVEAVETLGIAGIHVDVKQYRFYPFGDRAAALLGFVGVNRDHPEPLGLYGLEKFHDARLQSGADVATTIDTAIQTAAERELTTLLTDRGAVAGTVIVAEPSTGNIIALANLPGFNPNDYGDAPLERFANPAVQHQYEPGSVLKPVTMAAGIDLGVISPETTYTDRGTVTLNGWTIRNFRNEVFHRITMTNVLEHSVNTGAVFVEQQIGNARFRDALIRFGFGAATGVDFPDEALGSLSGMSGKGARAIDFATASYGQGMAATPLQLVAAYGALANGGLLMRPHLARGAAPEVVRRVVDPATARTVTAMLESAVRTNRVATIPGYRVAGKTGTAYIPDLVHGGYTDEFIHTFIGYLPASNPRFVILVKLERPAIGETAGVTVIPAFRELASYLVNYYRIPPDDVAAVGAPSTP